MSSSNILAIIIDDEYHGRENLRILIENFCPQVTVIQTFEHPLNAFKFIETQKVDLVFLDIGMPEIDGLEFLNLLPNRTFDVIFVTAYEDFAIRAIREGVLDYIVKPISVEDLKLAVTRAVASNNLKTNKIARLTAIDKIILATSTGTKIVATENIVYMESDTYLTTVYLDTSEKIVVSKALKYFEELLPLNSFVRIHRSFLVNINFIESYSSMDGGFVKVKFYNKILPIARRKKNDFIIAINQFTGM